MKAQLSKGNNNMRPQIEALHLLAITSSIGLNLIMMYGVGGASRPFLHFPFSNDILSLLSLDSPQIDEAVVGNYKRTFSKCIPK